MEALTRIFPTDSFSLLGLVLAFPALGAFVNGVFGKRLGKEAVRMMAIAAIAAAFLASALTFLALPHGEEHAKLSWTAWRWLSISGRMQQSIPIDVAFTVDGLSAVMMLVITGIGLLIHIYATEYMRHDEGFHRFFAYLNLFCFSMLILVMADNLALLFVGWEGVGLCSYLLIGFWYDEEKNAAAGKKAFIVNRIGDFGLLLAIVLLAYHLGTLRFSGIEAGAASLLTPVKIWPFGNLSAETTPAWIAALLIPKEPVMVYASTLVGLTIFLGCAGKSAQIPLYVWLPDAMAGPTPVSALIHAATMVTAGVYLIARTSAVFLMSPAAMATVAVVGILTALLAASIGLFQHDIKKVLAYSTVSQLGFMFVGVGVGAFAAGIFHVFTHAFFKACLFLGAGSVIHSMHATIHDGDRSQDMRHMGGLRKYLPLTHGTFLVSCLAIAGAPPLAGFWSKDEILWRAFATHVATPKGGMATVPVWAWPTWLGPTIYWLGILAATMTAFYMFRAYFMTFHGSFRGWTIKEASHAAHDSHDAHGGHGHHDGPLEGPAPAESKLSMTVPLMVLAVGAAFAGLLYAEPIHLAPLGHLLDPVFKSSEGHIVERASGAALQWGMMAPGFLAFLVGTSAAFFVYVKREGLPELAFAERFPRLYKLVYEKWRVDELYQATVVGTLDALADIFVVADTWIIDGVLAKLSSLLVAFAGTVLRALQTGRVQAYAATMMVGLVGTGYYFARPHANVTIDDAKLAATGELRIEAAEGLGYTYQWEGAGVTNKAAFGPARTMTVTLQPGDEKRVVLRVRNPWGAEAREEIPLSRPASKRTGAPTAPAGFAPGGE